MKDKNKIREYMETYILTFTEVFVNQKVMNVCENLLNMASMY